MNRIILASHGGLSAGMKDTVQMILGELPNLYALATLRDETEPITVAARRLLEGFAAEDAVYIVTDVMGGSVNNEMLTLLPEYPAVHLICGMNASLVLTLASNKAIAKMPKVEQLDEKIKMIFGNTAALLKFCQAYPKIKEINYGAVANKPGSVAFDQSVFLTPEEQADTQKLLDMGIKIYSQQTPTFKVVPIDHT